jgi:hypothetical protein
VPSGGWTATRLGPNPLAVRVLDAIPPEHLAFFKLKLFIGPQTPYASMAASILGGFD